MSKSLLDALLEAARSMRENGETRPLKAVMAPHIKIAIKLEEVALHNLHNIDPNNLHTEYGAIKLEADPSAPEDTIYIQADEEEEKSE